MIHIDISRRETGNHIYLRLLDLSHKKPLTRRVLNRNLEKVEKEVKKKNPDAEGTIKANSLAEVNQRGTNHLSQRKS